jgi:hypothetical protein
MPNEYPYPPIGAPLKLAVSNTSVSERAPLKTRRGTATIPWLGHADGHTAAPFSSARSTFLRPNLHRKKIRPRSPPPRYHSPPPPPTLPAKVQGGVGGGGPTFRPKVPGGVGVGDYEVPPWEGTLARYLPDVPPSPFKGPFLQRNSGRGCATGTQVQLSLTGSEPESDRRTLRLPLPVALQWHRDSGWHWQ